MPDYFLYQTKSDENQMAYYRLWKLIIRAIRTIIRQCHSEGEFTEGYGVNPGLIMRTKCINILQGPTAFCVILMLDVPIRDSPTCVNNLILATFWRFITHHQL